MQLSWQAVTQQPDQLGESPFWHPTQRLLYWLDIPARQLRRADATGAPIASWTLPSEPGCVAPAARGGWVMALRDGIYRARSWAGALEMLARFNHDPATTRFNDGKADPVGRFWAGTRYEPGNARKADLYCLDCRPDNGQSGQPLVQLKAHNAVSANGLAWAPDARRVYWADTASHRIHAWDWEAGANVMRNHRVMHQFAGKPAASAGAAAAAAYNGRPDGAAVDVEGNYWVAMYEGGQLLKLSPGGEVLQQVPVPVRCPTMPCFGGDDGHTLYVTTSRHHRSAEELAAHPLSGHVLAARVDVPGLPVNFFID